MATRSLSQEELDKRYPPIAIVGLGCRFPGNVNTTKDFERVMVEGIDVIGEIPADRWDVEKYWHPDPTTVGTHCTRRAGFLENCHDFDHTFFNISPREAGNMDVQQRHLMEVTQEALDDAGIPSCELPHFTGVYIGIGLMDHGFTVIEDAKCMNAYTHTGTAHSVTANRISFAYNIRGPSVAIDTACAASLTAMHYACFGLWNGECPVALVGGCNTLIVPEVTCGFSALGVLAPDGRSCPFSASAKGYVRSEGVGAVVLKTLEDALSAGDHVYCTIRGTWLAHNGYSLSITMPSTDAQAEIMKLTYEIFGLDPNKVDFIEAHGTGTPVGDPLEAEAVAKAFTLDNPERKNPLPVGSSKSHFGHLECAAGMAQVMKAALMCKNRVIYPNINFGEPNPKIDCEAWNIFVPEKCIPAPVDKKLTIGVNTFGFGGALAHMIFEEYQPVAIKDRVHGTAGWSMGPDVCKGQKLIIPLSAKTPSALRDAAKKWMTFANSNDAEEIICWLSTRRMHYNNRVCIMADSGVDFCEKLVMFQEKQTHDEIVEGQLPIHVEDRSICFVFPGQGQQSFDMGRSLYRDEPVFRQVINDCDEIYKKLSGKSFLQTNNLFIAVEDRSKFDPEIVNDVSISQPAILFLQVGLYHLLHHWGISAHCVVGHSLGEVACAYACGAMSLEEAVTVQYFRAQQQAKLMGTGAMAALRVSREEGEMICTNTNDLYVACINAHESITVAGGEDVIVKLCEEYPGRAKQVRVKCAFHTPHMDSLREEFLKSMEGRLHNGRPCTIPLYSTVTGHKYEGPIDAQYCWNNIRGTVEFLSAVRDVMHDFENVLFIELAGSVTLLSSIRQIAKAENVTPAGLVPCGQRQKDDRVSLMRALATLYTMGEPINWRNVHNDCAKWIESLPSYAWQHQTFRYEAEGMRSRRLDLEDRTYHGLHGQIRLEQLPYLRDHMINGQLVFPKSGLVEYMLQSTFSIEEDPILRNIIFNPKYIILPEEVDHNGEIPDRKQLVADKNIIKEGSRISINCDDEIVVSADLFSLEQTTKPQVFSIPQILSRCQHSKDSEEFYEWLQKFGVEYTDVLRFRAIEEAYIGDGESFAFLLPAQDKRQRIQTISLDAAFTVALFAVQNTSTLFTPTGISTLRMFVPLLPRNQRLAVYACLKESNATTLICDIYIMDANGTLFAEILGFEAKNLTSVETPKVDLTTCIYTTEWQPISACLPSTSLMKDFFRAPNLQKCYPQELVSIDHAEKYSKIVEEICSAYAKNAISQTIESEYHPKMVRYARRLNQMANAITTPLTVDNISKEMDRIRQECPEYKLEVDMIQRMGKILPDALKDPRIALTELFQEDMMAAYFLDSLTTRIFYMALADTIRLACQEAIKKKNIIRVLEVGGRLGGLTKYILKEIEDYVNQGCVEYCFTDINVAFFHIVQENLRDLPNIRYQQFDPENDIISQSLTPNSFDIVISLDTLHCTENGVHSASNMRDLLCQDGWLILMESTNNNNTPEIIFGAFDLCWIFEDERTDRCWMSQAGWSRVMRKAGFSDVIAVSTPNEFYHSLIAGRKTNMQLHYKEQIESCEEDTHPPNELNQEPVWTIISDYETDLTAELQNILPNHARTVGPEAFVTMQFEECPIIIVVLISGRNTLSTLVAILQSCMAMGDKPGSCLCVITQTQNLSLDQLENSMVTGVMCVASNEIRNLDVYHMNIEDVTSSRLTAKTIVSSILNRTHTDREVHINCETQIVPRVIRQHLKMTIPSPGNRWSMELSSKTEPSLDSLEFHDLLEIHPSPNEVKIKVDASAIHWQHNSTHNVCLGMECCGQVHSTGTGITHVMPGDEVVALGTSCLASHVITESMFVVKKPSNLTVTQAACSGYAYITAYYSMVEQAHVQAGETVFIPSACDSFGHAAICLARHYSAKIICAETTAERRQYLKNKCGVTMVTDSNPTSFIQDIDKWTNGQGVDVILNVHGGTILQASLQCLAHGGRFCQIGGKEILENSRLVLDVFSKNCSMHISQPDILMKENPRQFGEIFNTITELLSNGCVSPVPCISHRVDDLKNVSQSMQPGHHTSTVVLEIPQHFQPVQVKPSQELFHSNATYIITGGNSGIGQELVRWMADHGARHLVIVSRSGCKNWFQRATLNYLKATGANTLDIQADVSRKIDILKAFQRIIKSGFPPIKGVFHLAAMSKACSIEEITPEDLAHSLGVKAHSAIFLHQITQEMKVGLDYFVLFSSSKAMWGMPSLASFSAACNMLDQLATYRYATGQAALSVQCGWVRGAGWLEDPQRMRDWDPTTAASTIHIQELLHLLSQLLTRKDLPPVVSVTNEDWDAAADASSSHCLRFRHFVSSDGKKKLDGDFSANDLEIKVVDKLGSLLMMPAEEIDVNQPMIHYGVDSLISLDITNWMRKQFNLQINQMDILEGMTTASLIEQAFA